MTEQKDEDTNLTWKTAINDKGAFVRKESVFRDQITADGSSGYKAEKDRYHLYVSLACPWAHRTLIVRKLKGLEKVISYTVVDWFLDSKGWSFTDQKPKCTLDTINGCSYLREVYEKSGGAYGGRVTVPVLWDKKTGKLVNNESSELIRMLNSEFQEFCATPEQQALDLYPENMRAEIDELNSWIYPKINNGVYRSGFATSQEAYNEAVKEVFEGLDRVEEILAKKRYLTGPTVTEADVRLFTTLIRFDTVYNTHFKTNKKRIVDYPNIWGFTRDMYQLPGVAETVDQEHIMKHYFVSHKTINPHGVVPVGPDLDFGAPHGREKLA